jgi:hypothetical protein
MTDEDYILKWSAISKFWQDRFEKKPDLNAILYLIGVNEMGQLKEKFKKEEKMDLIHVAICRVLSYSGYYELENFDADGWPHYDQVKELPVLGLLEQERMLKEHVIIHFESEGLI